jgi:predicted RNA-binding Zn ribbon-like protein
VDYDTYGSNAVELAIDLANADRGEATGNAAAETAGQDGADGWATSFLGSHAEWFTPGTVLAVSHRDAARVAGTAALVREVALATTRAEVIEKLNALLGLARPRPYATDHDGELHLHYAEPGSSAVEQLTTTVAMGLSQVVVQHGWERIGVCSAEGCDNVYVDTSRNASRRYCSNTCASRSTVAAYRARRKA